jgi:hypothetical protein
MSFESKMHFNGQVDWQSLTLLQVQASMEDGRVGNYYHFQIQNLPWNTIVLPISTSFKLE